MSISNTESIFFYYSSSHRSLQDKIASKMKKTYNPIKVRVNGNWDEATQLVLEANKSEYISRYTDAKLITSGTLQDIVYQKGGFE